MYMIWILICTIKIIGTFHTIKVVIGKRHKTMHQIEASMKGMKVAMVRMIDFQFLGYECGLGRL